MNGKYKLGALLAAAILCLSACTPAQDNGLVRSTMEHLTIPGGEEETQPPEETGESEQTQPVTDTFTGSGDTITGFDEATLARAQELMAGMSLEQKVGQMFLARCPESDAANQAATFYLGGYMLFGRDFENKTKDQVISDIQSYQSASATPMFIAVDEEGGTVNRVSSNSQLRLYPFWSPQDLFNEGGMELIITDTEEKSGLLKSLGINMNLAPVCDVSTDANDFIYPRAFGQSAEATADYVSNVVRIMNASQMGSTLKHFPGYGNNSDTHTGMSQDDRGYETFASSDFLPFVAGIKEGATAVLVSHNIVTSMDAEAPASLSAKIHELLRSDLGFNGIIMTDDLAMDAIGQYTGGNDAAVAAVLAGNDMICTTDFTAQIPAVIDAVNNGTINEARINQAVLRILSSKIKLGIIE